MPRPLRPSEIPERALSILRRAVKLNQEANVLAVLTELGVPLARSQVRHALNHFGHTWAKKDLAVRHVLDRLLRQKKVHARRFRDLTLYRLPSENYPPGLESQLLLRQPRKGEKAVRPRLSGGN